MKVSEDKSNTENEPLPQILSFSAIKSHHVETDRTIRAMSIRHTIKNVSKPIDISSQNGASVTQKILITENSELKAPNTEKKLQKKLTTRYKSII